MGGFELVAGGCGRSGGGSGGAGLARTAVRKLGGTTGDVLGAGVELATTALLVMLAR